MKSNERQLAERLGYDIYNKSMELLDLFGKDYFIVDGQADGDEAPTAMITILRGEKLKASLRMMGQAGVELPCGGGLGDIRISTKMGVLTKQQEAFRAYCLDLIGLFHRTGGLKGMGELQRKHGVTGLTRDQFYAYGLHDAEETKRRGLLYFDRIYEEIKVRRKPATEKEG